jgi:hypothetical protein
MGYLQGRIGGDDLAGVPSLGAVECDRGVVPWQQCGDLRSVAFGGSAATTERSPPGPDQNFDGRCPRLIILPRWGEELKDISADLVRFARPPP